ncbi:calcium/sodium antiporter [Candidatus Falkowbacteria bacterium]|nr:calcium/sodium antiporter [Candidatus Falkowbacteria bacterium]
MTSDLLHIVGGLVLLVVAGDFLVRGAVGLARRLGIPALIVGLTVVAFGTSAPELMVSVAAALEGQAGIALGNVVGSNTANILLVLGLPALIATIRTDQDDLRKSYLVMLATAVLFIVISFLGPIGWPHALVLLAGLALMLGDQIRDALAHRAAQSAAATGSDVPVFEDQMPWAKILIFLALGLVGLPIGADLLVDGASNIARAFGVSETVIGLTLVAVGTSLPELSASVMAAIKGRADVAMGNVLGSNVFNLLGIIGVAGLISPMAVPAQMLRFDLWVMLGITLLLGPIIFRRWSIGRATGLAFVALYALYVGVLMVGFT